MISKLADPDSYGEEWVAFYGVSLNALPNVLKDLPAARYRVKRVRGGGGFYPAGFALRKGAEHPGE